MLDKIKITFDALNKWEQEVTARISAFFSLILKAVEFTWTIVAGLFAGALLVGIYAAIIAIFIAVFVWAIRYLF